MMANQTIHHHRGRLGRPPLGFTPVACAALLASQAFAQSSNPSAALPEIVVRGDAPQPTASMAGFGDVPAWRAPLQTDRFDAQKLKDAGVQRLADVTTLDASVSDNYNAAGYWDSLSIRGYQLDNRGNYRRDGLPINAETSIPLDNKSAVEIFKGTSGIQAGVSAPGGLVNLIVKRPDARVRSAEIAWTGHNSVLGAVDLADRFGAQQAFGLRVNAAAEKLDPALRDAQGHRNLVAVAGDWRVAPGTLLEAEIEHSHRSQPSQPGFSLLGNTLPSAKSIDPRINLNNQPWSQPVVLNATTASLRLQQRLADNWRATLHYGSQRLHSDDRLAYASGCSSEGWTDRYCSDGSFDIYDFRSDNESRRTDALDASVNGRFATASVQHDLTAGVLRSQLKARFGPQAYNWVGTGTIDGLTLVPSDPTGHDWNANRTERSTEVYARDRVDFAPQWSAWLGLRHTRLDRASALTDGTEATRYEQSFTTPWLALSHEFARQQQVYVSWGEGIETEVTPNQAYNYVNPGAVLPAAKSRQTEVGIKGQADVLNWSAALFNVHQPVSGDVDAGGLNLHVPDGNVHHRGLEGQLGATLGSLRLDGSATWLHADRENSANASLNGKTPTNVPRYALKLQAVYRISAAPGLSARAGIVREGRRYVLPDNSVAIPGWTRTDLGLVYTQRVSDDLALTWTAGVTNAFDQRAWRESPYQYNHAYLYPLAPRTWTLSMRADF
jgi:iron complex outermembrane receptor protein